MADVSVQDRPITAIPEKTRNALSRMAGGAPLVAMRDGVAIFDQLVEVSGEKRNLELAFRQLEFRAGSATQTLDPTTGKTSRTVDLVWTTGAPVTRYDWWSDEFYEESLEVTDTAIRMDRLNDGASLLNSHDSSSLDSVLGVVQSAKIENGNGIATVRFSNRADVDPVWQDVSDGIITKVSVGYRVYAWNIVQREGEMTTKTATDWEPFEVSLVAIPADSGCSVRSAEPSPAPAKQEARVADNVETTPVSGTATPPAGTVTRTTGNEAVEIIRYAANPANGVTLAEADAAIEAGRSFFDFFRANVAKVRDESRTTDVNPNRQTAAIIAERSPEQEMDLRAEMFSAECLNRYAISKVEPSAEARQFAGQGARGAAIAFLRSTGMTVDTTLGDGALIQKALQRSVGGGFTGSDFLAIYAKPAQAAVDQGWKDTIPSTNWQNLTGNLPLPDFDGRNVFSMSLFSGIGKISEDGELPMAKMSGNSYTAKTDTSGIKIMLTAQAQIRDNIGMWLEALRDLGISWNLYNESLFLNVLQNGVINSSDGKRKLFMTTAGGVTGNIIPIADLNEDTLETLVLALRSQRQSDKLGGNMVWTVPQFLMVSSDMERKAIKAVGKGINPNTGSEIATYQGITVVVVNSFAPKTVYLTGQQGMKNMIKRAFLEGNGDPVVERLALMSALRSEWESYQHSDFVATSAIGAVKGQLPA